MKKEEKVKGFTLIELVVTIGIIAVLSAILVPTVSTFLENARNVSDAANVKNIVTLLQKEAVLNADFADTMIVNPYSTNHKNQGMSGDWGYILFWEDSIRVSSEEVALILDEAGYVDYDSGRKYAQNSSDSIEFQYHNSAKTYSKWKTTNKGYAWNKSESIQQSTSLRCSSKETWVRYQIIWKRENGEIKFYVQATTKSTGGKNTKASSDAAVSEKLAELCGVPAYTGSDIDISAN